MPHLCYLSIREIADSYLNENNKMCPIGIYVGTISGLQAQMLTCCCSCLFFKTGRSVENEEDTNFSNSDVNGSLRGSG